MNSTQISLLSAALAVSSVLAFPETGQAIPAPTMVQLSNGNTTASVDTSNGGGMNQWVVGGQNQLNQQWFWYRTDSGSQAPINSISAPHNTQTALNTLTSVYNNGSYSVTVDYTLSDMGAGKADIGEVVTIQNLTASALDFHFFQYSDFNLGGVAAGDRISMDNYDAFQTKGSSGIAEGIIDPTANAFEANTTGGVDSTLNKLSNIANLTLSGNPTASGDVTWAFQWDLSLGAAGTSSDTVQILKDKYLHVSTIPEPSAMALFACGLAACGLARRRQ